MALTVRSPFLTDGGCPMFVKLMKEGTFGLIRQSKDVYRTPLGCSTVLGALVLH